MFRLNGLRFPRAIAMAVGLGLAAPLMAALPAGAQTAAPTAAQRQSKLDSILAAGVIRVGMTGDYKPFTFLNPATNGFEGIDVDMANALGKALGVKVEFVKTSWKTLMPDLEAGKYDIGVGGVSVTLERQKTAYFSTPVMRDGKTPITRCADKDRFQTLSDIDKAGVRLIVNPGGTNEKFAKAHIHTAAVEVWPDNVTIFDQIAQGKADLMITDAVETRLQQKLHPELCAVHPDKPFDFSEKAYMMPRDVPLQQFVDQWLHRARETGELQAVFDHWLK